MNVLITNCLALFGFRLWSKRDEAVRRLTEACLQALPSARASDQIEFYTRGIIDGTSSFLRLTPFSGTRHGPRGTFYLLCDKRHERVIVATVERALRDIGLDTGIAAAHTWRASRYQIPITGVRGVTEAEVWFNTVEHDDRVILVAVSLTDS